MRSHTEGSARRRRWETSIFVAVLFGLTVALAACDTAAVKTGALEQEPRSSTIDRPALDQFAPPDAVVNVKTEFGAVGDGRSDDTAAIQAAISAGLGFGNPRKIIYFPEGTYLISESLRWRLTDGTWSTWLTLMGANRDRTVLKLADRAQGFGDPAAPRAAIVTGSQNSTDGAGNQAFHNFIFDLTVDVGAGNPGADGIDFLANNRGAVRNVVVRAAPDSGNSGISMSRRWPGPAMIEDVRIVGFARGVQIGRYEYSMTLEDIRLAGQREAGIENQNNVLSVRHLISENTVPAVRNGVPDQSGGLLTLLDSHLRGPTGAAAALENEGNMFLRGVHVDGYRNTVRDRGMPHNLPDGDEWTSDSPVTLFGAPPVSVRLPVPDEPPVPTFAADERVGVGAFGAVPDDGLDDTAAIQAALESGNPMVHLAPGVYEVSSSLRVPAKVRVLAGFEASLVASDEIARSDFPAVFTVAQDSTNPLIFLQMLFQVPPLVADVERLGSRPIMFRDVHFNGIPFRGSAGPVFLNDVAGGGADGWDFTAGQRVWARQFNVESPGVKITNSGADLWILGLKTERSGTAAETTAGGRTEILGGLFYPVEEVDPDTPALSSRDSVVSATFAVSSIEPSRHYRILARVVCGGETAVLDARDSLRRVTLYSHECPGPPTTTRPG